MTDKVFRKLTNDGPKLTIEHLPALAEALQISTDDIVMYIIPWKLQAAVPLEISEEEWSKGMKTMRIDSIDRLRQALPNLRNDIKAANSFKSFYNFVFEWVRDGPNAKYLPNDAACDLWELLFTGRPFPMLSKWVNFIKTVHTKSISRDLWRQTLEFAPITANLASYDTDGAWPTAMDDFVEWAKTN
ncbi:cullin-binding protein, putative [Bodo saltans]|uniref:Defective in cullin neddylation protein n=1 Tax=Bodo saltans TaxID=75058 RepID=A0A0S4IZZ0_BODSA|nr:cullin-binding protein, putative [Bodo saltans]|eukprot:CUG38104.1 cullin-binding protein, putative [Bodo saltans]